MSLVEGPLQSFSAPPGLPAPVVHSRVCSSMDELHERPLSIDASPEPSTSGSVESNNAFFQHKLLKTDTLAGLAIRYNVAVTDIKRINGILTDNAMFAREYIKIPTGQVPMSEEAQVLLARLMSGYGRDASLNAKERLAPGTMSINQLPGSPSKSRVSGYGSDALDEDDTGTPYSRRSGCSTDPGDVELMERGAGSSSAADFNAYGAAGGYGSDRVRRRTRHNDSAAHGSGSGAAGGGDGHSIGSSMAGMADAALGWIGQQAAGAAAGLSRSRLHSGGGADPLGAAAASGSSGAAAGGGGGGAPGVPWQQLSQAIVQTSGNLITKIKRAASQPALPTSNGFGAGWAEAADALLCGPRSTASSRVPSMTAGHAPGTDLLSRGVGLPPRIKEKKGD